MALPPSRSKSSHLARSSYSIVVGAGTGLLALLCATATACADAKSDSPKDKPKNSAPRNDVKTEADAGKDSGATSASIPPRYVVATAVSDESGATTYVKVFDSFGDKLDLSTAREFAGWSDMGIVGGYVFVSSGEGPTVQRFEVDERNQLVDAGEIGFGDHVDDANFYNQTLISATKAYLLGGGEYVVWNPTTLEITGGVAFPKLKDRDGVAPHSALDRGAVLRGNRLYHTVSWSDAQELEMLPDSRIVVIDVDKDEVVDVLTVPCPDLNVADSDEDGNLYFSNWVYSPGSTLLMDGAAACAVRIPAGSEDLDDWKLAYGEASGHEGAGLGYLGEGKWMFSSFLNEVSAYDPDEEWFDWLFGNYWELRVLNPDTLTSVAVKGVPKNGGGYYAQRFDEITHVLLPGDGYTTTTIYGIGSDGVASKELETNGWATRLFKLP